MNTTDMQSQTSRRLLQLGIFLFLLGLLTGFAVPAFSSPRIGLSNHLGGVMNGMFLIALGLIWPRLRLSQRISSVTFWFAIYGTFVTWTGTLLAAIWGAGGMLPFAGAGSQGTQAQEAIIGFLLISPGIVMVALCLLVLWGLRSTVENEL